MKKNTKKVIFDAMSFLSCLREINSVETFERAENLKSEITDKLYLIDKELSAHFDDITYRQMMQIKDNLGIKSEIPSQFVKIMGKSFKVTRIEKINGNNVYVLE